MDGYTNVDRAGFAALAVVAYIDATDDMGPELTPAQRVELGRLTLESYASLGSHCEACSVALALEDPEHAATLVQDIVTDMFHLVDGLTTPSNLVASVLTEQSRAYHLTSRLLDLGPAGSVGLAVAATAAVLAYAEEVYDLPSAEFLTSSCLAWEYEAEQARIRGVIAERRAEQF